MSLIKNKHTSPDLYRSLYFISYPFLSFVFYFDIIVFLLLITTALSQTTFELASAFYYIKWAVLIFFLVFEYLMINFLSLNKNNKHNFKIPKSFFYLLIFLIYIFVTALYSEDIITSIFKSVTFFLLIFSTLIIMPLLGTRLSRRDAIFRYIYVFLIFTLVMNFLALNFYPITKYSQNLIIRFRGFFENPNTLGMFCFVALPFLLYKYKITNSRLHKFLNFLFIIIAVILPMIAASRASLLGIAIVLAVYFYYYYRRLFYIGTILSLATIFFVLISPVLLELMRLAEDPLSFRDKIWGLGLAAWKKHFFFGAGYGTTVDFTNNKYLFLTKGLPEFVLGKRLNNIYIEILYETGVIGLILFLTSMFFLIKETLQAVKNSIGNDKTLSICYFGLLIAVVFQGFFESFLLSAGNCSSLLFWILTGLVLVKNNKIDTKSPGKIIEV